MGSRGLLFVLLGGRGGGVVVFVQVILCDCCLYGRPHGHRLMRENYYFTLLYILTGRVSGHPELISALVRLKKSLSGGSLPVNDSVDPRAQCPVTLPAIPGSFDSQFSCSELICFDLLLSI